MDDLDTFPDDPITSEIAAHLVLARWTKYDADPDLSTAQKFDAIATDLSELRDTATALRAIAEAVANGSTPEAAAGRAAAVKAAQSAAERRFRTGAAAVERRVDLRKAADTLDREQRALTKAEAAFERLQRSDVPDGERLIAEGALEMQRARVRDAERALAEAQAK